ncbi:glycoprotein [Hymenopteran arli-related virus OKIAV98]|uniref:Glycoprotein n=1 Tax=Hymenopteran arli-related virus OKIAV98 TaxID=2792565 RepID=A0AAE7TPI5_9MONO|nr:glycoprotein [Hymenopteran arli-related virus OKIAV98]QPL15294.1 glycoprotein [Hymenopteran arli-related virus OKIAV98]
MKANRYLIFCLILIIIFIEVNSMHESSNLKVFDESHFLPSVGVYLEPGGHYLSYSGSIFIPFVYVLPNIAFTSNNSCSGDNNITESYFHVLEHLRDMVGIQNKARSKRMLFPIVSILSGGLSLWNTIEVQGIKRKIEYMQEMSTHMDRELNDVISSHNKIIDKVGSISVMVGDNTRTINRIVNMYSCEERKRRNMQTYMTNWLFSAPSEFLLAYTGALTGSVTPSLLSAKNLNHVILDHPDMKGTIYQSEPTITYELGNVVLTEVKVFHQALIKGIIQLPKIVNNTPMPVYNTYITNVIHNKVSTIIDLPGSMVCDKYLRCWEPDMSKCLKFSHRLLCLYGSAQVENTCLEYIRTKNDTSKCDLKVRAIDNPVVVQTRSGVLIGGSGKPYKVYKRQGDIDVQSTTIPARDTSLMINQSYGDWISIDDNIYSTKISGYEYNFTVYLTPAKYPIDTLDKTKIDDEWKNIEKVKYEPIRFDSVSTTDGLYMTIISCVIFSTLYCFYSIYERIKDSHAKVRIDYPAIHELIGSH